MKNNQKNFIKQKLLEDGYITRNFCLKNYISRLASHITVLKNEGWEFETENVKIETPMGWTGTDYKYKLIKAPLELEVA